MREIVPESASEAYDRGTVAGEIGARLAGHDKHFARINGSLERVATELHEINLNIQKLSDKTEARDQRLEDQAAAREATAKIAATALEKAEQARRAKSESAWTPFARLAVAISTIAGVIGIALAIYANVHH
jgi:chromosome segregation ATPase